MRNLTLEEMGATKGGEAVTLATVMAMMAVSIVLVACYRMFKSSKGKITLPGPYTFSWD